ncbi:hypothetical protein CKO51_15075 [Rhodopirellula sp. SM50]|nr:hypothetical protein [Rhodopirellula sp. SM50]PAY18654.1 hypothetical protein CKO51_15075 [Rhodopirellula sp. SM50]
MRHQRNLLYFAAYIVLSMAALMTVKAEQPLRTDPAVPDGAAQEISDWALAGVIWSDASLAKKLAIEAAKRSESNEQKKQLQAIAEQSNQVIAELEAFGWTQVKRSSAPTVDRDSDRALPDPKTVGAALAKSLDRPNRDQKTRRSNNDKATEGPPPSRRSAQARTATDADGIKRLDTETPAGIDDPGLDDERTADKLRLDIDQYRVDDYIDETPREAGNLADAIEDGTEAAIAAAAGRRAVSGPQAGHISLREAQTRSATMPYSKDSIYDRDDYDPDADYDIDNPLGTEFTNPESADFGDGDDEIDRDNPAKVIDGEDELTAALQRSNRSTAGSAQATAVSEVTVDLDRYTSERSGHLQDANWVQFHLNVNQATWSRFTTRDNLVERTGDAVTKLKADAAAALHATDNPQLASILKKIVE